MTTEPGENQTNTIEPTLSIQPSETMNKNRSIPIWLLCFLLLVLGCTVASTYLMLQSRERADHEMKRTQAAVSALQKQQTRLAMQFATTTASLNTLQAQGKSLEMQFNTSLQNQGVQTDDWMLLKARACLEFAQMNAYWTTNIDATKTLLRQADELLAQVREPALFDVRRLIAENITQVSMIEKIDGAGLLSQLDAAKQLAQQLKIKPLPGTIAQEKEVAQSKSVKPSAWRLKLQDSLSLLEKLVVVRRVDTDIQPLVTPAYTALLRENIQLVLQETQLAVLQSNEKLYQLTLKQATQKINQSFDQNDPNTLALLRQLDALQKRSVVQQKPDLGEALLLLNHVIDAGQGKKSVRSNDRHVGAPTS